jgi:AcrR family transcriptional regulator
MSCEVVDPRIRRTRQLLQESLSKLLETKDFYKLSVLDITEAATLNRATFYDHYGDKFALLECMVGARFHALLAEREVRFDGTCASALKATVLAVSDYLTTVQKPDCARQLEPHMESAIIAVVRRTILDGLRQHRSKRTISPEMLAAAASWAIYGAAKEWFQTPHRCSPETMVDTVITLVSPIFPERHEPPALKK